MRALVTGASGLVGSHLCRALVDAGHTVRALVRSGSNRHGLDGVPVEFVLGDVLDRQSVERAVENCQLVFHAAAVFAYWGVDADELEEVNVQGTRNVVAAAAGAGVARVVVTSSSVTCGSSERPDARDETFPFDDPDPPTYYLAKLKQERAALDLADRLGLDLVVVCPTLTVGPHDHRLVPSNAVIVNYLSDPFRTTWPGGCNVVHAADVAAGHVLLAHRGRPGERYLLGGANLEWRDLHRTLSELCGTGGPFVTGTHTSTLLTAAVLELAAKVTRRPPGSTRAEAKTVGRYYWYSHAKAAALGYSPRPARAALADGVKWLVSTGHVPEWSRSWLRLSPEVTGAEPMMHP